MLVKCECVCCVNNSARTYAEKFGSCLLSCIVVKALQETGSNGEETSCSDFNWNSAKPVS